jgi:putative FmdB family regulatory protein
MPFYEYECSSCKFYTEVMQKISDTPLTKCPSCGKKALKKLVSAPNFRLKGGGWYETDFKGDKENKRNLAAGDKDEPKADAVAKPDSKSDAKGDSSKADAKGEPAKADVKGDSSKGDSGGGSKGDSSKSDGGSKAGESKGSGSESRAGSDKRRSGGSRGAKPAARVAASKGKAPASRSKSKPSAAKKKARR